MVCKWCASRVSGVREWGEVAGDVRRFWTSGVRVVLWLGGVVGMGVVWGCVCGWLGGVVVMGVVWGCVRGWLGGVVGMGVVLGCVCGWLGGVCVVWEWF